MSSRQHPQDDPLCQLPACPTSKTVVSRTVPEDDLIKRLWSLQRVSGLMRTRGSWSFP